MTDVERVARAVKRAAYIRKGNSPVAAYIAAGAVFVGAEELADMAAAIRETRLIDAAALRAMGGLVQHRVDVADWLAARAKEQQP